MIGGRGGAVPHRGAPEGPIPYCTVSPARGGGSAGTPQRCVQVSEVLWGGGGVCGQEGVVPRMGTRPGSCSAPGGGRSNLISPTLRGRAAGSRLPHAVWGLRKDPTPPEASGCCAGSPVAAVPRFWGRPRPAPPGPARPAPAAPRQVHSPRLARARRNRRAPLGEAPRMPRPGALLCAVLLLLLLSPAPGSGQAGEHRTGTGTAPGRGVRSAGAARAPAELGVTGNWGLCAVGESRDARRTLGSFRSPRPILNSATPQKTPHRGLRGVRSR